MKLGPHIQVSNPEGLEWAKIAPIVKQMDNVDILELSAPGAITIFRKYYPHDQEVARIQDPLQGWYVANEVHEALDGFEPTYVEAFNETAPRLASGLREYAEFMKRFVWRSQELGHKVAGFCFPTGTPEDEDILYLQGEQWCGIDVLNLHCYWGEQGLTQWNALRYRRWHELSQGNHPPIIISECGRDAVEGGKGGWLRDGTSPEKYVTEILQFNAELEKDSYVIGGTPFTSGPVGNWMYYTTDTIWRDIVRNAGPIPAPLNTRRSVLLEED